jgi:hypothetical protein
VAEAEGATVRILAASSPQGCFCHDETVAGFVGFEWQVTEMWNEWRQGCGIRSEIKPQFGGQSWRFRDE